MNKVHDVVVAESHHRRVLWHKPMALLSFVIALNVASMPLKAYLSESFPWQVAQRTNWTVFPSFEEYNSETSRILQAYYTKEYFAHKGKFYLDRSNATTLMHWSMSIPRNVSPAALASILIRLPGAFFYGDGLRNALAAFVLEISLSSSSSLAKPPVVYSRCQHVRFVDLPLAEQCVWLVPDTAATIETASIQVAVYQTMLNWQNKVFLWAKLVFRLGLTAVVCRAMARQYYCHYIVLVANFLATGLRDKSIHALEIYVGDPTPVILSNTWISLAFVVDFWLSASAVGESLLAISQHEDLWAFHLAILYTSRSVWFAYFFMRLCTYAIKKYRLEESVVPLDPTMVAVASIVYTAPLMVINTTTALMHMEYALWSVAVTAEERDEAIDVLPVTAAVTIMLGALPLLFSVTVKWYRTLKVQGEHCRSITELTFDMTLWPNDECILEERTEDALDLKQRLAFKAFGLKRHFSMSGGGSIYTLHALNPAYNRMPLFNHRGSDCFVVCRSSKHHEYDCKMRLSLWRSLDLQEKNPALCLHKCTTNHLDCLSRLDATACPTFKPADSTSLCIHLGRQASPWIL
ncbi:unnamed protein product [Aphanomyces euteiches]